MKSWKVNWVSKIGSTIVDHDGIDASAVIVNASDIMEAYRIAAPIVMMKCAAEGADDYKIYDIGIMEDDVF